nr:CARDB domain-containing protein [Myxococcota bacterium]
GQGDSPRRRILDAGDLDAGAGPGPDRPELVYASEDWSLGDAGVLVQVYALDDLGGGAFDLPLRAELVDETSPGLFAQPSWAVTVGAFDGPDVRLGAPDVSTVTEITQPLVLLQAPPVHFDILSGIPFDLNDCFPPMVCDFRSTYERRDVIQSSVVAEFHADWVLSEELEGDVSLGGTTVAGSLASTFGVGFSKVEEERRVETFEVVQTADLDDWIYAATVTYDLWEYPVFVGGDTQPSGHVLVVRPRLGGAGGVRLRWFNSKSWTAQSFLPDHEVGNVLSYRAIARPDEANGYAEEVRWATSDARGLTAQGGGGLWSIALQDVSVVTRSYESFWDVEQDFSVEGVVEFPIEAFDPGSVRLKASVAGTYGESAVSTLSMSVDNSLGLHFDFGPLAPGIGETEYSVTPYAYWAKNGALVLAYAAEVGEAGPGGTDTWWDANYKSAPDPTFILPWKYDPEKGFPVQDEAKRQQTRDIRLEPSDARTGDVVEIQARIQNYSLVDAPSVGVRFYLGDPQDGGTRIFGETPGEIVTGVIPRRESKVVSMRWRIPHDLDTNTARIYAVIDPSFDLVELQETNNTGWAPFVIPAPEPGRGLLAAAALLSLGWIRGRNRC